MKSLTKLLCLLLVLPFTVFIFSKTAFSAEDKVEIKATWTLLHPGPKEKIIIPKHAIKLSFYKNDKILPPFTLLLDRGSPPDVAIYKLKAKKNGVEKTLSLEKAEIKGEFTNDSGGEPKIKRASQINLVPEDQNLDYDTSYSVEIKAGTLAFWIPNDPDMLDVDVQQIPDDQVVYNEAQSIELINSSEELKLNDVYIKSRTLENKIEFLGGEGGGDTSIRYSLNQKFGDSGLHLRLLGTADFNFQSENRDNYFNSLVGEVGLNYPFLCCGSVSDVNWTKKRYVELSLLGRVESDQKLDNADGVVGASFAIFTKDPISGAISRFFAKKVPVEDKDGKTVMVPARAVVSPLIVIEYNYVREMEGDEDEAEAQKVDTEDGNNRVKGTFHWSLPIAQDVDLSNIPLVGSMLDMPVDADILFQIALQYDFNEEEFFDQSTIAINFTPDIDLGIKPSLTFSWARGEAPPVFEDFNAFLAGLKMAFGGN